MNTINWFCEIKDKNESLIENRPHSEVVNFYPTNYKKIIKDIYNTWLFDPYSAVYAFEDVLRYTHLWGEERTWRGKIEFDVIGWGVYGTLNSKNRFGGYVGAHTFFAMFTGDNPIFLYDGSGFLFKDDSTEKRVARFALVIQKGDEYKMAPFLPKIL